MPKGKNTITATVALGKDKAIEKQKNKRQGSRTKWKKRKGRALETERDQGKKMKKKYSNFIILTETKNENR